MSGKNLLNSNIQHKNEYSLSEINSSLISNYFHDVELGNSCKYSFV